MSDNQSKRSVNALTSLVKPELEYSVVIPTHNRKAKLNNLMRSIENLSHKPEEVLILDDASTDGTEDFIHSNFPYVRYFKMEREMWTAFTLSYGIAKARKELVYIIDDDNVVDDSSIDPILEVFGKDSKKEYGVLGPVTCWFKDKDRIMYAGVTYNKITGVPKGIFENENYIEVNKSSDPDNKNIEVDGIPNAFMLRRSYAILAGLIPRYLSFIHDDGYLIYSIKRKLRKRVCVNLDSRILHDFESYGRLTDIRLYYTVRNKILFTKEQYPTIRAVINLVFVLSVVAYYVYKAYNQDPKNPRIKLLLKAFKDGMLNHKSGGPIKW